MRPHRRTGAPTSGDECNPRSECPSTPELLLICEAWSTSLSDGRWRFSIESTDGAPILEAVDEEPGDLNRLTLLAAVRGLEAIDGPARVVLLSTNRYLIRSLADSLPRWRANDFAWEHFGRVIDIQHASLWRRIDRALRIHRVEACLVSSRLVSSGRVADDESPSRELSGPERAATQRGSLVGSDSEPMTLRIDGPQDGVGSPTHFSRTETSRPPAEGLRRLLLGLADSSETTVAGGSRLPEGFSAADGPAGDGAEAGGKSPGSRVIARHRFTSADLMETP